MTIGSICPQCNEPKLHRSRERGARESLAKTLLQYKPYRCHNCGWRAMLRKTQVKGGKKLSMPTYIGIILLTIAFAIVAALWISSREIAPPPAPAPSLGP